MSWTVLATDDHVAQNLEQVLLELKTALNEREAAIGLTLTSGWSSSTHIGTRAIDYIAKLITGVSSLIAGNPTHYGSGIPKNAFLDPTDRSTYALADLLADAGGYSTWPTYSTYSVQAVSDKAIWKQFQDVFDQLYVFRTANRAYGAGLYSNDDTALASGYRTGGDNSDSDVAWANAIADSYTTPLTDYRDECGWSALSHEDVPTYEYTIIRRKKSLYETSFLSSGVHGSLLDMAFDLEITGADYGNSVDVDFVVTLGESEEIAITALGDGSNSGAYSISGSPGFAFGVDYSIDIVVAADETSAPVSPLPAHDNVEWLIGHPAIMYFFFDITPALTYG